MLAAQRSLPVESRRRLGGFETLMAASVPYGLGCIYYIVDMEGPADTELLRRAMRLAVKRHPNLRSRIVDGWVCGGRVEAGRCQRPLRVCLSKWSRHASSGTTA